MFHVTLSVKLFLLLCLQREEEETNCWSRDGNQCHSEGIHRHCCRKWKLSTSNAAAEILNYLLVHFHITVSENFIDKQPKLRGSQVVACNYLACALWLWWSWWSEWWLSPPRWAVRTWYSLILSDWLQLTNLKLWWAGLVIWLSLLTRSASSQAQLVLDWW